MNPDDFHGFFDQFERIFAAVEIKNTPECRGGDLGGPTFDANVDVVIGSGLETGPERAFDEWKEENVRSAGVRFVENDHLSFVFEVLSVGTNPMSSPPDFEPENAHEFYVLELANGDDVAAVGLDGVESDKGSGGR